MYSTPNAGRSKGVSPSRSASGVCARIDTFSGAPGRREVRETRGGEASFHMLCGSRVLCRSVRHKNDASRKTPFASLPDVKRTSTECARCWPRPRRGPAGRLRYHLAPASRVSTIESPHTRTLTHTAATRPNRSSTHCAHHRACPAPQSTPLRPVAYASEHFCRRPRFFWLLSQLS